MARPTSARARIGNRYPAGVPFGILCPAGLRVEFSRRASRAVLLPHRSCPQEIARGSTSGLLNTEFRHEDTANKGPRNF